MPRGKRTSVGERFAKHTDVLRVLAKGSPAVVRSIMKTADTKLIHLLSECAINVLNKNVPVTPHRKRRLAKYKREMHALSTRLPLERRRKTLQTGGFLSVLLPALLPTIFSAVAGLFKKRRPRR